VAGRYVVLTFFGSAGADAGRQMLTGFRSSGARVFDEENAALFGVSVDPDDERNGRVAAAHPGMRVFWDFDLAVSRQYRAAVPSANGKAAFAPLTYVLDPRLRVLAAFPLGPDPSGHAAHVVEYVAGLPRFGPPVAAAAHAPALVVPHVFEPDLCRDLVRYYDARGGTDSGFMRDEGGKTVGMYDYSHKRRRDQDFEADEPLRRACMVRVHDRLVPEVERAFQFKATRMERYIVACYEGEHGGHFRAHRDNTTLGTAHRKFAVSLFLNTGEFEGGRLWFPEFGRHQFVAPPGGAVVFSCSLLHEATPVTHGRRYMFLPFLYDDAAAKVREANEKYLGGDANRSPGDS
jgi:peroxiredoxin/predicted 2-oxoglutarate/Fe(II)-dependent dioxygenase YbiX